MDVQRYLQFPEPSNGELISAAAQPVFRPDSMEAIRDFAVLHNGIAVILTSVAGRAIAAGRLRTILQDYERPVGTYALLPQSRYLPPKIRAFVDFLVETCRTEDCACDEVPPTLIMPDRRGCRSTRPGRRADSQP
jgi:DNA-binding transcriptional LysR family regulator